MSAYTILCGGCNRYKQECVCRAAHPTTEPTAPQTAEECNQKVTVTRGLHLHYVYSRNIVLGHEMAKLGKRIAGQRKVIKEQRAALATARQEREQLRRELNPVCADETLLGAVRNLQQAHISQRGNAETLLRLNADLRRRLEVARTFVHDQVLKPSVICGHDAEHVEHVWKCVDCSCRIDCKEARHVLAVIDGDEPIP